MNYQYQDLNTSNKPIKLVKPVKELSDKIYVNNIFMKVSLLVCLKLI